MRKYVVPALLSLLCVPVLAISTMQVAPHRFASPVRDELDPKDSQFCDELGNLQITFQTEKPGSPTVGIVLTDPRGRRIGFDSILKRTWQELPEAQGYVDCDASGGGNACRGVVEVCGPLSGTYKLEVIAKQDSAYRLKVSGRSEQTYSKLALRSSTSETELDHADLAAGSRRTFVLDYSRDPVLKVSLHPYAIEKERLTSW
jgi:hypothetical protein